MSSYLVVYHITTTGDWPAKVVVTTTIMLASGAHEARNKEKQWGEPHRALTSRTDVLLGPRSPTSSFELRSRSKPSKL